MDQWGDAVNFRSLQDIEPLEDAPVHPIEGCLRWLRVGTSGDYKHAAMIEENRRSPKPEQRSQHLLDNRVAKQTTRNTHQAFGRSREGESAEASPSNILKPCKLHFPYEVCAKLKLQRL